jgi:predicted amidophosphoribosyltransferase
MESLSRWISQGIHPCLHCGSFLKTEGFLCNPCRETVSKYLPSQLEHSHVMVFDVFAAFRWNPGVSDLLSSQLVHLKGPHAFADWNYWAERFVQRRFSRPLEGRRIRIVPAPSSTGRPDHAYHWAEALSRGTGAEFFPCLKKGCSHKQRGATLEDRLSVEVQLDENNSELAMDWAEVLWVFADDIVTTGSTALAAYKALGSPPHFEVWALAKRTLSCGASTDLL